MDRKEDSCFSPPRKKSITRLAHTHLASCHPGKDKEKSAYVAVPESGNSLGRLKSREVMVFEIRLEHKGQ
jgi:hypothetical protein